MKKRISIVLLALLVANVSYAQSLIDVYKKGTVKLIPDNTYAQNNDWSKVFGDYRSKASSNGRQTSIVNRMSIVMKPDGSVVVSYPNTNTYTLFDSNGNFVKDFGITDKSGNLMSKTSAIKTVLNNVFLTNADNMGNMICMDFNGSYIKTLKFGYMIREVVPMQNSKFAIVAIVLWKDRTRDFVAIVDYNTNEEKIIWDSFTPKAAFVKTARKVVGREYVRERYRFPRYGYFSYSFDRVTPSIAFVDGKLLVADSKKGEIIFYDMQGNQLAKDHIEKREIISVSEQKEIRRKEIEDYKKMELSVVDGVSEKDIRDAREFLIEEKEEQLAKIDAPITLPFFSTLVKDSDGNILFFEFPKQEGANQFNVWVYKNGGEFVCQSRFACDDYDLSITPSKMVFYNGYLYAIQTIKSTKENPYPLRLVRFKLS